MHANQRLPLFLNHYDVTCTHATTGGDGLFMVVDEGGVFREDNFQKAITQLNDAGADGECVDW